jgi:hypothetical protein
MLYAVSIPGAASEVKLEVEAKVEVEIKAQVKVEVEIPRSRGSLGMRGGGWGRGNGWGLWPRTDKRIGPFWGERSGANGAEQRAESRGQRTEGVFGGERRSRLRGAAG